MYPSASAPWSFHRLIPKRSRNLDGTYIIRLFAEFETGAREYWTANWTTYPKAADLLDGLAARCGIPDTQRHNAHKVRDYRNALVHEREDKPEVVAIAKARGYLCHFFSYFAATLVTMNRCVSPRCKPPVGV